AELRVARGVDEAPALAVRAWLAAAAHPRHRPGAPSLSVPWSRLDLGLDPVAVSAALGAAGGGGERFHVVVQPQSRRPQVLGEMPCSARDRGTASCTTCDGSL